MTDVLSRHAPTPTAVITLPGARRGPAGGCGGSPRPGQRDDNFSLATRVFGCSAAHEFMVVLVLWLLASGSSPGLLASCLFPRHPPTPFLQRSSRAPRTHRSTRTPCQSALSNARPAARSSTALHYACSSPDRTSRIAPHALRLAPKFCLGRADPRSSYLAT